MCGLGNIRIIRMRREVWEAEEQRGRRRMKKREIRGNGIQGWWDGQRLKRIQSKPRLCETKYPNNANFPPPQRYGLFFFLPISSHDINKSLPISTY